jgi:cytochrome c oxidase subunit II
VLYEPHPDFLMIMMKTMKSIQTAALVASMTLASPLTAIAAKVNDLPGGPGVNQINMHAPATAIAVEQHWLHNFMLIICSVIFVLVFAVMFYSIFAHRKSRGAKSATFHESVGVEIAWTVIPFIIVILMALPATKTVVAMKDTSNADITIKATGYQWKWGYDYLTGQGQGIGFLSTLDTAQRNLSNAGTPQGDDYLLKVDNPLVVPVDKKVRIITTANDVIHAWMVPAFGVKQDAIPGFVRDTWFRATRIGDFYGQCAELCGKEHAYMPIHVKVVTQEAYTQWVDGEMQKLAAKADDPNKTWTLADLQARGEKIYASNCVACHKADGVGAPPAIKGLVKSAIVLDADYNKQIKVMLNGAGNGAMPSWKQLSDTDLAAVVTYTKNAWGNNTGHVVQPRDFVDVRAGKTVAVVAGAAPAATAAAAPAAAPIAAPSASAPVTAGLPLSVFFASGQSGLDAKAKKTLEQAVELLKAAPNAKVALSGFVDASGSAARNADLAKERAVAVRDALQTAGIAADRIEMRRPQNIEAGSAAAAQARRVDIVIP